MNQTNSSYISDFARDAVRLYFEPLVEGLNLIRETTKSHWAVFGIFFEIWLILAIIIGAFLGFLEERKARCNLSATR